MLTNNALKKVIYLVLVILALSACGTDDPPAAVLQAQSLLADQIGVPAEKSKSSVWKRWSGQILVSV